MATLKYWTGSAWQVLPYGLNIYEQTGDPGIVPLGSVWIDTDDSPPTSPLGPTFVTSLPASPVNGQEVYYQADAANGVVWHLRYNAGSANANKWEYLGGQPLLGVVDTQESTATAATWLDLTTVGPAVVAPLAGVYLVDWGAQVSSNQATVNSVNVGVAVGAATPTQAWGETCTGTSQAHVGQRSYRLSFTAGDSVRMRYYLGSALTTFFVNRWLELLPVRVG